MSDTRHKHDPKANPRKERTENHPATESEADEQEPTEDATTGSEGGGPGIGIGPSDDAKKR